MTRFPTSNVLGLRLSTPTIMRSDLLELRTVLGFLLLELSFVELFRKFELVERDTRFSRNWASLNLA